MNAASQQSSPIYTTKAVHNGDLVYRIEVCQVAGVWMQRHVWIEGGAERLDEHGWIRASRLIDYSQDSRYSLKEAA